MRYFVFLILNFLLPVLYDPLSEKSAVFLVALSAGLAALAWYGLDTINDAARQTEQAVSGLVTLSKLQPHARWKVAAGIFAVSTPLALIDRFVSDATISILLFLLWVYSGQIVQRGFGHRSPNPIRVRPLFLIFHMGTVFMIMLAVSPLLSNRGFLYLLASCGLWLISRYVAWGLLFIPRRASRNAKYHVALNYYENMPGGITGSFLSESTVRYLQGWLNLKMRNYTKCRNAALDILHFRTEFAYSKVIRSNAIDLLGLCEESQGNFENAVGYIRAALQLNPSSAAFHDHLVWVYMSNDMFDEGIPEIAETGLKLARKRSSRSDMSIYFASQAWGIAKQAKFEEARHAIDDAFFYVSRFASEAADFHYRAGRVYEVLEDTAKARENYEQAIELDPNSNIAEKAEHFLAKLT